MKVLSLDSSTQCATCAILEDDKLLGEISFNYKKQHSVVLMPMVQNLLKNSGCDIDDIDGFVVSKGPGSFTGLRIGMAVVKGLSQGSNKPFVSVSTLDSLANNMAFSDGLICPIMDALRSNVYTAVYKFSNNQLERLTEYMAISIDELISLLKEHDDMVTFIGDGVPIFKEKLSAELSSVRYAPAHLNIASSASLARIGIDLLKNGANDDIYTSSPIYLRKSQAEREYDEKMEKKQNDRS